MGEEKRRKERRLSCLLLEDVENKSIASSHHQAPTRPIPHLMDVECFSPDAAAKAAMATRLVLLSRGKGPRRLAAARFDDGRRAIGFVRARRPMTPTIGDDEDDSNGELAVACWCCSSCCGRMLTLFDPGPSGVGDKETGEAGLSSLGEKRKKEVDWFRLEFFFFFCRGGREKIFVSFGVVVAVFFHSSEKRKNFNLLNLFLDSLESCRASPRPSPPSWPRAPWRRSARAVSRPRGELEAQVRGARCKCAGGEGWDEVVIQEELKARAREQESKRKKERSKREAGGGHSTLTLPIPTLYPHARGAPSCSSLSADPFRHGATRLSVWRGRHGSKGRAG